MYRTVVKLIVDFIVSAAILIISLPLWLIVLLVLFVVNRGNPFFVQKRIGFQEKVFNVVKFKTMTDRTDEQGELLPDDKRLTPVGMFVRKTSLDELPQLFNVLKGDMSLIGPRPLLVEYLPLYNSEQKKRHDVKPGITGWAQVNGRNSISWKKKFEYDVWYVKNQSLLLDLRIIFLTVYKVFKAEGVQGQGVMTMERFTGNN